MQRVLVVLLVLAIVGTVAFNLVAQEPGKQTQVIEFPKKDLPNKGQQSRPSFRRPGPPPFGSGPFAPPPPPSPVIEALDADDDGEISAEELKNAVAALKSLDKNKDGKLDRKEIHPPPPFGPQRRGPRGRGPGPRGAGSDGKVLVERLKAFDENKDGKLTKKEVPERMQGRLFEMADKNDDDVIDAKELRQLSEGARNQGPRRDGGFGPPRRGRPPLGGRPEGEK